MDCVFCKIIAGEIPSKKLYEDEKVYAFYDINPQMPVHFLVIPKEHIESAAELNEENADVVKHIFVVIAKLAKELSLADGYRVITNSGAAAGQTVVGGEVEARRAMGDTVYAVNERQGRRLKFRRIGRLEYIHVEAFGSLTLP